MFGGNGVFACNGMVPCTAQVHVLITTSSCVGLLRAMAHAGPLHKKVHATRSALAIGC